jgi:uncharacterized C2H2 Zn-finger protein
MNLSPLIRGTRMAIGLEACPSRKNLFKCPRCGRMFKTALGWFRHMLTQRGKLRRRCP